MPVRREAEALHEAGADVDVVLGRESGKPAFEVINGVRLHRLRVQRTKGGVLGYLLDYLGFFLLAAAKLARLHHRDPFDVVQVNTMPDALVFAAFIPKLRGAKVLVFMQEPAPELAETLYGSRRLARLLTAAEQAALRWADGSFTVTQDLKERYVERGAVPEKIRVVLNGPDPRHLTSSAATPGRPDPSFFTVICHGTIEDRYGQDTILRAIRLLVDRIPNIRLRLTGRGAFVPRMLQMIEELDLADRVDYLHWVELEELVDLIRSSDAGIVAQKSSPYSNLVHTNKMYDYMHLQVPVVMSRLTSVQRYFDEDSVFWFDPDDEHSLAEALWAVHQDPSAAQERVQRAAALCERYGWLQQRREYLHGFHDVGIPLPAVANA